MSSGTLKGARSMSFLSPKRRKTTGNLKVNGHPVATDQQQQQQAQPPPPATPSSPTAKRPSAMHRPLSQPVIPSTSSNGVVGDENHGDGNLFYAYARKGDDLKSRYLLTFASATVANEWWLHLQANFPDAARPGPQLFSFKTDNLLSKAWRHPSLAHLKSKWMYISFSDAPDAGIGGAAQGIIPVQDLNGNMLGGSAPASPESASAVREVRHVRTEVNRLEEHFEKMMAAVERNTEKVVELAAGKQRTRSPSDVISFHVDSDAGSSRESVVDMGVLSGHFVRMNELLSKNTQHVEQLTRKHQENEDKLRQTMESLDARQKAESLDMRQLSSHLDRIQSLMEKSALERKDSAREISQQQSQPLQVDFSPLTDRLEKVQEAVEQNSALVKSLLSEGEEKRSISVRRAGEEQTPSPPDLTPLTQHLERIHSAVEQQSEHMKTLVSYASGETTGDGEGTGIQPSAGLAPLAEHLEQIYGAIEEGNALARKREEPDFSPVAEHLESLREHSQQGNEHMESILEAQNATREAVEANGGEIDFTPLAELLDAIRESTDSNAEVVQQLLESQEATRKETAAIDLTPLTEHVKAMREATDRNSEHVRNLAESQQTPTSTDHNPPPPIDLTPLTDRLNRIHTTLQKQAKQQAEHLESSSHQGTGDSKFLMNALTSHLSKIQGITEQNAKHVQTALREKQQQQHSPSSSNNNDNQLHEAVSTTSEQIRQLVTREEEGSARLEAQKSQMRELMSGQREMVEVMRSLAKSLVAMNKGACDHVVVPPPRKMERKVVGFVYDAKEGG